MNRHVVAGFVGMTLAASVVGCAQGRLGSRRTNPNMPPVEITPPLRSIHEAINMENPSVDPKSLRAGFPADFADPSPGEVASSRDGSPGQGAEDSRAEGRPEVVADQGTAAGGMPTVTTGDPAASLPEPPKLAEGTGLPAVSESSPVAGDSPAVPDAWPAVAAQGSARPSGTSSPFPPSEPVSPPVASSNPAPTPVATTTVDPVPAPRRRLGTGRDPLLGPNPDIMPEINWSTVAGPPTGGTAIPPRPPASPGVSTAPTIPARLPATPAEVSPPGQREAVATATAPVEPQGGPEIELAPTEVKAEPTPSTAQPAAPESTPTRAAAAGAFDRRVSRRDPLLGPDPDIMPVMTLPSSPADASPAAQAPASTPVASPKEAAEAKAVPVATPAGELPGPVETTSVPAEVETSALTPLPATDPAAPPAGPTPPASPIAPQDAAPAVVPPVATPPATPTVPASAPVDATVSTPPKEPVPAPAPEVPKTAPATPAPVSPTTPAPASSPKAVPPTTAPAPPAAPAPPPEPKSAPSGKPAKAETCVDPADAPVELPPLSAPEAGPANDAPAPKVRPTSLRRSLGGGRVRRVSYATDDEPTALRSKLPPRSVFEAGKAAARVGDEVITLHELKLAITQRRKSIPADQPLSRDDNYMLAKVVLNDLVDKSVVVQEAKRELKNPKQLQIFMDQADKLWTDEELPPLLRQTSSSNIYELRKKLEERGESLDDIRKAFRQEFLFRGYIEHKLGPKMKVDLHEMHDYYAAHLKDFDRPAQVTWREILVETGRHADRASAKRKADAALARVLHGEDFAAVARAESDGPNKSDGGFWETSPGSYAVPAVNSALATLPVGRLSAVIEGPTSYHVVRVEGRRAAGPASFSEVQDKVKQSIRAQKIQQESSAYLDKLRKQTLVWTVFQDPGITRTSATVTSPSSSSRPSSPR